MYRGFAIFLLAILLTGCFPQHQPPLLTPWVYTDLRYLDEVGPPEDNLLAGQDLIAVYTRAIEKELQIRLDFLDLQPHPEVDLYLALDTTPGGSQWILQNYPTGILWDTVVVIPAIGAIQALNTQGVYRPGLSVRVLRDPLADTITISLDRSALPIASLDQRLQVFLTRPGDSIAIDSSMVIDSEIPNPPRAPVLLVFWNTLAAYSPSQAMRRWDGAHTGPLGGRHGLRNLLRAARNHQAPLTLLDLKLPASLSAMDYLNGMQMVRAMVADGLLILPDAVPSGLPGQPSQLLEQALSESRITATTAGLPNSPFAYLPFDQENGSISPKYSFIFIRPSDLFMSEGAGTAQILRSRSQRVLPLPALSAVATDLTDSNESPPLGLRRALAASARREAENQESDLLVVGGDFQQSLWGDPQFARQALDWFQAHPWIKLLGPQDMLAQRTTGEYSLSEADSQMASRDKNRGLLEERISKLAVQIIAAPPGTLTEAARQSLFSLFSQGSPALAELDQLRANYAGQIFPLLAAARWSENPAQLQDCSQDLGQDGSAECILASKDIFAVFDIQSGSLTYLFTRSAGPDGQVGQALYPSISRTDYNHSIHELVAPSSQFTFGLDDPGLWDLSTSLAADPEVIPGAFYEPGLSFTPSLSSGQLNFTSQDSGIIKTYSLLPDGIRVDFQVQTPLSVQIPLALDPWLRFKPDWGQMYAGQSSPGGWSWGLVGGPRVHISSNGEISANSFIDTRDAMGSVEDPNADFPPGHFLPFPISLVEVRVQRSFFVEIRLQETGD